MSSFDLPACYLSCFHGNHKKRGVKPKRTPAGHYIATVKMLRESLSTVKSVSSDEDQPESQYPSNTKEKRKQKATGVKTLTENDGPGEHEDVGSFVIKPNKVVENHFDDCGDDIAPLLTSDEKLLASFSCFECEGSSTQCPSDNLSEEDSDLESMFDSVFTNWAFPGSEEPEEQESLSERPTAMHFASCSEMISYLATQ